MRSLRHVVLVAGSFTLLFGWLYARPLVEDAYLAGTDLYDYYLPIFLAPITIWSSFELSGMPAFADSQNAPFYPLTLLFAHVLRSWTAFLVSAYVIAAACTYAYVYWHTGSKVAAAFAGVAYGMSEAMMERLEHASIVHATAWLPLMLLAIDRLRGVHGFRRGLPWVAIGACAVGCAYLAGHTQPAIYMTYAGGLYALVGGLVSRAGLRYYVSVFFLFAGGGMLAAVSALPLWETRLHTVRQSVSYGQFVSHSNTPAQMLSFLFPSIVHEGREAPTYVGLAVVLCAIVGLREAGRNWLVPFWAGVGVVALMAGAGDATPVARLLYELPLYDSFRVVGRHLFLAAFAFAVLSGFGVAAVCAGRVSWRPLAGSALILVVGVAGAAVAIGARPEAFALERSILPQLGIAALTLVVCVLFFRNPHARLTTIAVLALLIVDLTHALPHPVRWFGLEAPVVPATAIQPSVHARRLQTQLAAGHQRLLSPDGVTVDPVVPGAFARLWKIPVAGGYGAIMPAPYAALASMGTTGAVDRHVFADDNRALDLLAVKYVLFAKRALQPPATFQKEGTTWAEPLIDVSAGPAECGQRHPRTASFSLPPDRAIARLSVAASLGCSDDVPQGTTVAVLRVVAADGTSHEVPLRAGLEIAETGLGGESLRRRAKHQLAKVFEERAGRLNYLLRVEMPRPATGARLEVVVTGTPGWVQIDRLTATDASGRDVPVSGLDVFLHNRARWRQADAFATSRVSDRVSDEQAAGEEEMVVLENVRSQPRAWLAKEVVTLGAREMLTAVHHSLLPDGRAFDPARTALIDGAVLGTTTYEGNAGSARVDALDDGMIRVDVSAPGGGFLVLSESFYPGWRARVGTTLVPVQRTNLSLQGVPLPPGRHVVTFEFAPQSLRTGAIVSAVTLVTLLAACVWTMLLPKAAAGIRVAAAVSE